MKFVPVTVTVVGVVPPVKTTVGESVIADPGAGLLMAIGKAAEVPPPGVEFTAVSDRLPAVATSLTVSVTFTCVLLTKVVVRALPFASIAVVGTKPVPVTATVGEAVPVASVAGMSCVIVGTGLVTSKLIAAPDPLLAEPFNAITESCAPLASC
jgi:hypothetical protein